MEGWSFISPVVGQVVSRFNFLIDSVSSIISDILFFLGFLSSPGRETIFIVKGRVATAKLAGRLVKDEDSIQIL